MAAVADRADRGGGVIPADRDHVQVARVLRRAILHAQRIARRRIQGRALDASHRDRGGIGHGCGSGAGVAAQIARRIGGSHAVGVAGRGGKTGVVVSGRYRGADLRKAGAARPLTAFDEVLRHADVIGGGYPAQVDLRTRDRRCRKAARRGRRRGISATAACPKRCHLHDPPAGRGLGRAGAVAAGGQHHPILHQVAVRVRDQPLRVAAAHGGKAGPDVVGPD